jgi:hypothetical protein
MRDDEDMKDDRDGNLFCVLPFLSGWCSGTLVSE